MTYTVSIAFFGRYRPAAFEGDTLADACALARNASAGCEDAAKIAGWLTDAEARMSDRAVTGTSIEHGQLCVSVKSGPHDRWLDSVTRGLPDCPGLDYSEAAQSAEA